MERSTRRRLLATLGTGGVTFVAGCTGGGDAPDGDDEGDATDTDADPTETDAITTETDADSTETDPNATETDADGNGGNGEEPAIDHDAEEALFTYLQAIDVGDVDAANEALHPESDLILEEGDITEPGVAIHELELIELRAVVRERFGVDGEELDERTDEREQGLDELVADVDGDDYVHVFMSITSNQYGDEEAYVLVIQDEGWLVWGEPPERLQPPPPG